MLKHFIFSHHSKPVPVNIKIFKPHLVSSPKDLWVWFFFLRNTKSQREQPVHFHGCIYWIGNSKKCLVFMTVRYIPCIHEFFHFTLAKSFFFFLLLLWFLLISLHRIFVCIWSLKQSSWPPNWHDLYIPNTQEGCMAQLNLLPFICVREQQW